VADSSSQPGRRLALRRICDIRPFRQGLARTGLALKPVEAAPLRQPGRCRRAMGAPRRILQEARRLNP
jgi:hypothetical protein